MLHCKMMMHSSLFEVKEWQSCFVSSLQWWWATTRVLANSCWDLSEDQSDWQTDRQTLASLEPWLTKTKNRYLKPNPIHYTGAPDTSVLESSFDSFKKGSVVWGDCVAPSDTGVALLIRAVSPGSHLVPLKSSLSPMTHLSFSLHRSLK